VGTGGVGWADTTESTALSYAIHYKMYQVPVANAAITYKYDLSTIASPLASFNGTDGTRPLRMYAQPTIVGTDIYVNLTNLSVDNNAQLTLPYQHAGLYWGLAARFKGATPNLTTPSTSTNCSSNETCVYASGVNYSGGSALLYTESGNTGSPTKTITLVGGGVINRQTISGTGAEVNSDRDTTISLMPAQTRSFKVLGWFGMD